APARARFAQPLADAARQPLVRVALPDLRVRALECRDPRAERGVFREPPFEALLLGRPGLAQPVAFEHDVRNRVRVGLQAHLRSQSARVLRRLRSRLRTPETESPTSLATCSRVRPSRWCSTAIVRLDSGCLAKSRSRRWRAAAASPTSSLDAMRWSSSSSGVAGRRLRVRIRVRQTLVAMR